MSSISVCVETDRGSRHQNWDEEFIHRSQTSNLVAYNGGVYRSIGWNIDMFNDAEVEVMQPEDDYRWDPWLRSFVGIPSEPTPPPVITWTSTKTSSATIAR